MAKKKRYEEGERVKWKWGDGHGRGTVEKVYTRKVTRKIAGSEVTRNASDDEPAYYIKQSDGDAVLKSHSEVTKA
ncbi:hypervirulence associated TUDOR domain-containing protein [Thalassoroseus pseudoceratinae]|uniref:DUF2945 domain-containing protein n=1 Tax=Thalassoroseus pseudoceratinae TaxID=2713176 RepID=UPI0014221232|nr:DUF2945 domain-containing protein [Thalassoroseus pseudoceratinae]